MKRIIPVVIGAALAATISITSPPSAIAIGEDLSAMHVTASWAYLPDTAISNSAQTKHDGLRAWRFYLTNNSGATVTNPSVTVNSGYDPTLFTWGDAPVTGFPATKAASNLPTGQQMGLMTLDLMSSIPYKFTTGYDSTRTVDNAMIPPGASQQKVTVTITPRDRRYDSLPGGFDLIFDSNLPGVSLVGWTAPPGTTNPADNPQSLLNLRLWGVQTRMTYTFTATLKVPNQSATALRFVPNVGINGQLTTSTASLTGTSVAIPDATLDGKTGKTKDMGTSTFSVCGSHTWMAVHAEAADINYAGTDSVPPAP
jgi:hypothetical protein